MNAKPYPKYKASGVEWLGNVPEHWEVKRGRFSVRVNPPSEILRKLPTETEVSFVPMEAVGVDGGLKLEQEKPISEVGAGYTEFQDQDIIVAKITPCFENGKAAIALGLTNQAAYGTTELHVLRSRKNMEYRFLFYVVLSDTFRKLGEAEMYGAGGQKRVPPEFCKDFRISLPPHNEQQSIADFLDERTGKLDALLGKKRELIVKLKEKRSALISRTVTKGLPAVASAKEGLPLEAAAKAGLTPNPKLKPSGIPWLGDIPEHWEVKKLSWLFSYGKGREAATLTKEYVGSNPGEYPVYSGQTANHGLMGEIDTFEFDFKVPVILVTTVGAKAMTTRLVSGKLSLSQNCALIIPRTKELVAYFYEAVLQRLFDYEKGSISLIMQPSLRFEDLDRFHVPLMSSSEQLAIAAFLKGETSKIDRMIQKVETAISKLTEYRTALITAAVTGKIDVRIVA